MQFVVPTQTTFESLLAVLGVSIFFEMNFKRRNSIILKFCRINPHSVHHGVLWDLICIPGMGSLSEHIYISIFKRKINKSKCVHLMTHPGLLMRAQNIQKSNTPW